MGWERWLKLERTVMVRYLRSAAAAAIAFEVAKLMHSAAPATAAVAALLITQSTGQATARRGLERAGGVFIGFLFSLLIGHYLGLTWWVVGLTVLVGVVVGEILRLGSQAQQVAVTALFVMGQVVPTAAGQTRLQDNIVGALMGLVIGVLVPAGSFTKRAGHRIPLLAGDATDLLKRMSDGVEGGLLPTDALGWLDTGRRLTDDANASQEVLQEAQDALRWSLHGRADRERLETLDEAGACLLHVSQQIRGIARGLSNLAFRYGHPPEPGRHPELPTMRPPTPLAIPELPAALHVYLADLSRAVYRLSRMLEEGGPNLAAQRLSLRETLRFAADPEEELVAEIRQLLTSGRGGESEKARNVKDTGDAVNPPSKPWNWRAITLAGIVEDGRRIRYELDPDSGPHRPALIPEE